MSFDFDIIKYQVGENKISIRDLCETIGRDYERLIQKSGFQYVHRTEMPEDVFFTNFINEELSVENQDFVIFVNQSISSLIPGKISKLFSSRNDLDSSGFLEISDGCTGFARALVIANAVIESRVASRVHIICAEKYSKFYDDNDESVSPIFSDAISLTTLTGNGPYKIKGAKFFNDFGSSEAISVKKNKNGLNKINMEGGRVLTWVMNEIPKVVNELLSENNLSIMDVNSWYVHQGSRIVVESLLENFGVNSSVVFEAENIGNTMSSSIPIMMREKSLPGSKISIPEGHAIILGFGVGLSVVAVLLEINS
jgi:3-oxoacyl-[acyl-carrier-protein] synthase III